MTDNEIEKQTREFYKNGHRMYDRDDVGVLLRRIDTLIDKVILWCGEHCDDSAVGCDKCPLGDITER